jgi:hypothetical protein
MTESGLTKTFPNDTLQVKNYNFSRQDKNNRKSLGIITYWTKDIKKKSSKVFASEHTCIVFHEFTLGIEHLHFGTIYRLPNAAQEHQFCDFLENALDQIVHSDRQIFLIGDANIDLFKQGRKQEEYLAVLESFEMKQRIRTATRNCGTSSTLIDHLIISPSVSIDKIANSNLHISDHHIIGCRIKSFGFKTKPKIVYQKCKLHAPGNGLDYDKCDVRKVCNDLMDVDWTIFYNKTEPEEKWAVFKTILSQKLSENTACLQCKCGKTKRVNNQEKPWFSQEINALKSQCDQAYKSYSSNGKPQLLYDLYKTKRNRYNSAKKRAKLQYYKTMIETTSDYKEKWKVLNEIRGKNKTIDVIEKLQRDDKVFTDKKDIANELNDFFSNVGQKTLDDVRTTAENLDVPNHGFPRNSPSNSFKFRPPTAHHVIKAINALKPNKPAGPMGIPAQIIKKIGPTIAGQIADLFRVFINKTTVPIQFKEAYVTPSFKTGDQSTASNYRPIAVTSVFSKMFEQILLWQIQGHLDRYAVLAPSQYGFRKNHSTVHAIINCIQYGYDHLNAKADKYISFLYLDLSKAFDCIDHTRLRKALDAIGFDKASEDMILNLLENRPQYVKLDNTLSKAARTNCGVAQGSQIGPIIFSIYVNDCYRTLENGFTKIVQYADDVCIITRAENKQELLSRTEQNLIAAKNYFMSIGLKLNVAKTQYLPATNVDGARNELILTTLNPTFSSEDQIKAQNVATYLGLEVDNKLIFNDHKAKTLAKLKSIHALVRSVRSKLSFAAAKLLYNSLFLSTHDYGAAAYGTEGYGTAEINNQLEAIHRKMLKCVHSELPWDISNEELYRQTSAQTLSQMRNVSTLKLAHGCVYKQAPRLIRDYMQRSIATARGHQEYRVTVPLPIRTNMFKHSFAYRGATLWNTLPHELRETERMDRFREALNSITS